MDTEFASASDVEIAVESAHAVWGEIQPLLEKHWREIAHFEDIPLNPRREMYMALQDGGLLRVFTARSKGVLVGYAVYTVGPGLHYATSKQAIQDVLFLAPEFRSMGNGAALISFADDALRAEHVQVVYHHVKLAHDFGPLLRAMGYRPTDTIYARRLDHGG